MRVLAQVKRFLERYQADSQFRAKLSDGTGSQQFITDAYGLDIDPRQALPLFSADYRRVRFAEGKDQWPVAKAWDDYLREMLEVRRISREEGGCAEANLRFDAWRRRQIQRCASELGPVANEITHPVLAFELSAGCSIGCWFCGVSAERFQENFLYTTENARLWQGILEEATVVLGPAVQHGFCYWATDPSDNPDYPRFLEDYYLLTGSLPQTTTAAPLKDLTWTRRVMNLFDRYRCIPNRFSILSLKTLDRVHATFTAEELMGVELVLLNRESLQRKAMVGRAIERQRTAQTGEILAVEPAYSTIACVSGFLVNLVKRSVQLITPTRGSDRWPLGYRIFGVRHFTTPQDFRAALEDLIDTHMPGNLISGDVLSFRDDLTYVRNPHGFGLHSAHSRFAFGGFAGAELIGDLIHQGRMTVGEIETTLTGAGVNIFVAVDALQMLFDRGLLDDDRGLAGIKRARRSDSYVPLATLAK
jgi:radical SAM family RiPP maturation amino acid epimerase